MCLEVIVEREPLDESKPLAGDESKKRLTTQNTKQIMPLREERDQLVVGPARSEHAEGEHRAAFQEQREVAAHTGPQSKLPSVLTLIGYASVRASSTAKRPNAARNLPRMTSVSRTGMVSKISIVPWRFSSAKKPHCQRGRSRQQQNRQ